eukprot:1144273-Pelagomonas_calceolata.AAC.2
MCAAEVVLTVLFQCLAAGAAEAALLLMVGALFPAAGAYEAESPAPAWTAHPVAEMAASAAAAAAAAVPAAQRAGMPAAAVPPAPGRCAARDHKNMQTHSYKYSESLAVACTWQLYIAKGTTCTTRRRVGWIVASGPNPQPTYAWSKMGLHSAHELKHKSACTLLACSCCELYTLARPPLPKHFLRVRPHVHSHPPVPCPSAHAASPIAHKPLCAQPLKYTSQPLTLTGSSQHPRVHVEIPRAMPMPSHRTPHRAPHPSSNSPSDVHIYTTHTHASISAPTC